MKKNLTKKLMLSVLTLAFAVVSLGASTFAWFTMSSNAKVSAFEGTVKGAEGVEIAITALTWNGDENATKPEDKYNSLVWYSGVLPAEAITPYINEQFAFSALTSDGAGSFKNVEGTTVDQDKSFAGTTTGGYIGFRLWFKTANTDGDVLHLENIDFVNSSDTVPTYTIDQEFSISSKEKGKEELTTALVGKKWTFDVTSAARVSLNPQSTAHPATDDDAKVPFIYEADENPCTPNNDGGNAGNSLGYQTTGAYQYYNEKVQTGSTSDALTALPDAPVTKQAGSVTATSTIAVLNLEANTPTYLDVYVWIEGWDGECINGIFSQSLKINFDFILGSALA